MSKTYYMMTADGHVFETVNPDYHKNAEVIPAAEGKRKIVEQCRVTVAELLQGVKTVYGIVRHVSASGMSRNIDLYIICDNAPVYLTGHASKILGWRMAKDRGMIVSGCGMDMVFHAASSLVESLGIEYQSMRYESL